MCGCLSRGPHWGPGPQPRHVTWLGIEPLTLWFADHAQSTELHQPGLCIVLFKNNFIDIQLTYKKLFPQIQYLKCIMITFVIYKYSCFFFFSSKLHNCYFFSMIIPLSHHIWSKNDWPILMYFLYVFNILLWLFMEHFPSSLHNISHSFVWDELHPAELSRLQWMRNKLTPDTILLFWQERGWLFPLVWNAPTPSPKWLLLWILCVGIYSIYT